MYTKMFAGGGVASMLGGLTVAVGIAAVRRRYDTLPRLVRERELVRR